MTNISFSKMHGLGNDFLVIDSIRQDISKINFVIPPLANRYCGIGFDQLLLIEPATNTDADFCCRIFNADGSEAEQCGNGMRCIARYIHEQKVSGKKIIRLQTRAGIIVLELFDYENIRVNMGLPIFRPDLIPCTATQTEDFYTLTVAQQTLPITALSMGNPHAIICVDSLTSDLVKLGKEISQHAFFPNGANVGFIEIISKNHLRLKTYERGSGETLACGSNACAAAVASILNYGLENCLTVELSLGKLLIQWQGKGHPVFMTGPASHVFSGTIDL